MGLESKASTGLKGLEILPAGLRACGALFHGARPWLVLSWSCTFVRALCAIALAQRASLAPDRPDSACVLLLVLFMLLDAFDGVAFRRGRPGGGESAKRRIVDSSLDFLSVQFVSIVTLLSYDCYFPIFLLVLAREVLVSLPCVLSYCRGHVLNPGLMGKLSVAFVGMIGVSFYLAIDWLVVMSAASLVFLSVISLISYIKMCGRWLAKKA